LDFDIEGELGTEESYALERVERANNALKDLMERMVETVGVLVQAGRENL
jgi:hypothetical protein